MTYVVFIMTGFCYSIGSSRSRDILTLARRDADVDDEAGAVVGTLKDIAFEAHELAPLTRTSRHGAMGAGRWLRRSRHR